eukprot:325894-Prorocentrum_minimum.AAC.1
MKVLEGGVINVPVANLFGFRTPSTAALSLAMRLRSGGPSTTDFSSLASRALIPRPNFPGLTKVTKPSVEVLVLATESVLEGSAMSCSTCRVVQPAGATRLRQAPEAVY